MPTYVGYTDQASQALRRSGEFAGAYEQPLVVPPSAEVSNYQAAVEAAAATNTTNHPELHVAAETDEANRLAMSRDTYAIPGERPAAPVAAEQPAAEVADALDGRRYRTSQEVATEATNAATAVLYARYAVSGSPEINPN